MNYCKKSGKGLHQLDLMNADELSDEKKKQGEQVYPLAYNTDIICM